jgi:hypothetical protein
MKTIVNLFFSACFLAAVAASAFSRTPDIHANKQEPVNPSGSYVTGTSGVITTDSKVVVNTIKVFNIEPTSATCNYIFRVEIGKSIGHGVCVGKSENPTIAGTTFAAYSSGPDCNVNMSGLPMGTSLHVRAYVKTGDGKVWYGNDLPFTTLSKK